MTTHEFLFSVTRLLLRHAGAWQNRTASHHDIVNAVHDCAQLLREPINRETLCGVVAALERQLAADDVTGESYDYAADDFNFDAARESRIFGKGR